MQYDGIAAEFTPREAPALHREGKHSSNAFCMRMSEYLRPELATGKLTGRYMHREHPSATGRLGTAPSDDSPYLPVGRRDVDSVETFWEVC